MMNEFRGNGCLVCFLNRLNMCGVVYVLGEYRWYMGESQWAKKYPEWLVQGRGRVIDVVLFRRVVLVVVFVVLFLLFCRMGMSWNWHRRFFVLRLFYLHVRIDLLRRR